MSTSSKKFGVELEIVKINAEEAAAAIRTTGIQVEAQSYNHKTCATWKIVPDASLYSENGKSCEVVSPPLVGEEGLREVAVVAKALMRAGASVNQSCGLHVHVDASGMSISQIKAVVTRYSKNQDEINAVLPVSRRYGNRFARKIDAWRMCDANETDTLARCMGTRYTNINLTSILRHGTIEFRQHSGSVDAKKITNWIRFCLNMAESTVEGRFVDFDTVARQNTMKGQVFTFVRENPTMSLAVMIHSLVVTKGIKRATALAAMADAKRVISGQPEKYECTKGAFDGLSEEIVAYYAARKAQLSQTATELPVIENGELD